MASGVLIVGPSGSGKSTGIRNLDPQSTFIINSDRKDLPIAGAKKLYKTVKKDDGKVDLDKSNYFETDDPSTVLKLLDYTSKSRPDVDVVIVDTINHIMTSEFIKKAGVSGFDKWTQFAVNVYNICKVIQDMRPDMTVFVLGHTETNYDADGNKVVTLRTLGKLLNEKIDIPSMFTTTLFTYVDHKDKVSPYGFITQSDGASVAKSPMGMFELKIPNDYAFVAKRIHEYATN